MYADELLRAMRPKLNDYYFGVLFLWVKAHKTHGIFKQKTKFEVSPTSVAMGYWIKDTHTCELIAVYDKDSLLCN